MLTTYPFGDPNPVPILTSNTKIYPYHKFEGYSHNPSSRELVDAAEQISVRTGRTQERRPHEAQSLAEPSDLAAGRSDPP